MSGPKPRDSSTKNLAREIQKGSGSNRRFPISFTGKPVTCVRRVDLANIHRNLFRGLPRALAVGGQLVSPSAFCLPPTRCLADQTSPSSHVGGLRSCQLTLLSSCSITGPSRIFFYHALNSRSHPIVIMSPACHGLVASRIRGRRVDGVALALDGNFDAYRRLLDGQ